MRSPHIQSLVCIAIHQPCAEVGDMEMRPQWIEKCMRQAHISCELRGPALISLRGHACMASIQQLHLVAHKMHCGYACILLQCANMCALEVSHKRHTMGVLSACTNAKYCTWWHTTLHANVSPHRGRVERIHRHRSQVLLPRMSFRNVFHKRLQSRHPGACQVAVLYGVYVYRYRNR
jgi:hypothetical protein